MINTALELYSRIGMGQLEEILQHCVFPNEKKPDDEQMSFYEKREDARRELERIKCALWALPHPHAYWSISSMEIHDSNRVAWDIQQVIRHRLAWDNEPNGGWTVQFDRPMRYGGQPLPRIERVGGPLPTKEGNRL